MAARDDLVDYLTKHIVGPFDGPNEQIRDIPNRRYLCATLYPLNVKNTEILEEEEVDASGAGGEDGESDDPVTLANEWMPSSIGLTFYMQGTDTLECQLWGAVYHEIRQDRVTHWQREELASRDTPEIVRITKDEGTTTHRDALSGKATIRIRWRRLEMGYLVTATLVNANRQAPDERVDPGLCLHQVGLRCCPIDGYVAEYPTVQLLGNDPEEEELRLQYIDERVFAVGHGCAAGWDGGGEHAKAVWTETVPTYDVPAVAHSSDQAEVFKLSHLASAQTQAIIAGLRTFVEGYGMWAKDLASAHNAPDHLFGAKARILARLDEARQRMSDSIDILATDPVVMSAFRQANKAMLMQMRHSKPDIAATRRNRGEAFSVSVEYSDLEYAWRPFQLGFMLVTLASAALEKHPHRETVDLLWFPTGGGKTEAYLCLAAFQILLRRLRDPIRGAGTTVITRYTLRLLTSQQFQRAATLVCAMELIRNEDTQRFGTNPITIGLWVGSEVTPNEFHDAVTKREELLEALNPSNPFQLETCPWCGTEIVPEYRDDDENAYGIRATNSSFELFCPNTVCDFHRSLPVQVVDAAMYASPPTILLATVDKFARLAWIEKAGSLFGGRKFDPPSLIIQDELHLLTGPLGTTVGIYEAAINALASWQQFVPKVVASTATIRRAADQVLSLFSRDIQVFPPPGVRHGDSYFSHVDRGLPGRRYVGLMSHSHTPHTTIVHTAAALLQAPTELGFGDRELDGYWTLVAYHNSLRELGRTVTLARDDIPSRIEVIARDQSKMRAISYDQVVELTSNVPGYELPQILAQLSKGPNSEDAISVLASTNMLSVGVDIPRLGLMLVNGQPKSTAEYIQASSRVGRDRVPGLVVTLYVATKPRDRSHYESFIPYHKSLYKHVEPATVTPFSLPCRMRALHAALVILVRHACGLSSNDDATLFDPDNPDIKKAMTALVERAAVVDADEAFATKQHLEQLADQWVEWARQAKESGRKLYYHARTRQHSTLLADFGSTAEGWPTLHSMRNVDRQCSIYVMGERDA
jgi:hypothetical protein